MYQHDVDKLVRRKSRPRVAYVHSQALQGAADRLPANLGRSSLVHSLAEALNLLCRSNADYPANDSKGRARVVEPELAIRKDLLRYHDAAYVDYLLKPRTDDEGSSSASDSSTDSSGHGDARPEKRRRRTEEFGLEDDCPPFPCLPEYCLLVAGATLTAMRALASGEADIAVNWEGGRHHAKRKKASGFCYVADIVIGIMALAKLPISIPRNIDIDEQVTRKPRIMYLDLDIHQGDGVAQAFHSPNRYPPIGSSARSPRAPQVLTLSLHHSSPLFFPPPDPLSLLPSPDTPHPFTLSIPLKPYACSATYARLMMDAVEPIMRAFDPDFVVLQLGLDGLARDPLGKMGNWSLGGQGGVGWCIERIMAWNRPLCVLGGGGYHHANAARGWAFATSVLIGEELQLDTGIPEHEHLLEYAPSFQLDIDPSHAPDQNDEEYLGRIEHIYTNIAGRIRGVCLKAQ